MSDRIIRQGDGPCVATTALAISWGLSPTCYVAGCSSRASTIIIAADGYNYTLCEEHYQQANAPSGATFLLDFSLPEEEPEDE